MKKNDSPAVTLRNSLLLCWTSRTSSDKFSKIFEQYIDRGGWEGVKPTISSSESGDGRNKAPPGGVAIKFRYLEGCAGQNLFSLRFDHLGVLISFNLFPWLGDRITRSPSLPSARAIFRKARFVAIITRKWKTSKILILIRQENSNSCNKGKLVFIQGNYRELETWNS